MTAPIPSPDLVLAAAEEAPEAFRIEAYHSAILRLREKGHSWRRISDWLREFNIEVSYVHLRRLFGAESAQRSAAQSAAEPPAPAVAEAPNADEEKWTRL